MFRSEKVYNFVPSNNLKLGATVTIPLKVMNIQEFSKLAGFTPTEYYYHNVIEVEYMRSSIQDKAEWVKLWKKDGGIQKAYDAFISKAVNQQAYISNLETKLDEMNEAVEVLERKCKAFKNTIAMDNEYMNTQRKERKELMYFLIESAEKWSASDIREKVIDIIGAKEYISYKLEHGLNLWDVDKKLIIECMK